jgi:hypothetical protein
MRLLILIGIAWFFTACMQDGSTATPETSLPAGWSLDSAFGYVYGVPSGMAEVYEFQGIDAWGVGYENASMHFSIAGGMINPIDEPKDYPGYTEKPIRLDTLDGFLVTYAFPDSVKERPIMKTETHKDAGDLKYYAGAQFKYLKLQFLGTSPSDLEAGKRIFRLFRARASTKS